MDHTFWFIGYLRPNISPHVNSLKRLWETTCHIHGEASSLLNLWLGRGSNGGLAMVEISGYGVTSGYHQP